MSHQNRDPGRIALRVLSEDAATLAREIATLASNGEQLDALTVAQAAVDIHKVGGKLRRHLDRLKKK